MITKVRQALRRKTDSLDEEIQDCINACYSDMARVGIAVFDSEGKLRADIDKVPLVIACQKHYARWQFNFENAAERYKAAYEATRDGMSLCKKYTDKEFAPEVFPGTDSTEE